MSTISLTPPTSPPDQQLLGDPKLSMMPPSSMTGGGGNLGGGGGYLGGGMATSSLDAMYAIPEIVAPPKVVSNKLAGKIWRDWTLPRDTTTGTGRISPIAASPATPAAVGTAGYVDNRIGLRICLRVLGNYFTKSSLNVYSQSVMYFVEFKFKKKSRLWLYCLISALKKFYDS